MLLFKTRTSLPDDKNPQTLVDAQVPDNKEIVLTRQLLTTNSQFEPLEECYNHEAIAILLHSFRNKDCKKSLPIEILPIENANMTEKEQEKDPVRVSEFFAPKENNPTVRTSRQNQIYISAGSEDLKALLPRLILHDEHAEAFIFFRPYIHSMGLYLRRFQGTVYCFLFDSQNWGLRYPPTRLCIEALLEHFSNSKIILSGTELQSKNFHRGCTEYTLANLEYCLAQGSTLFQDLLQCAMEPLPDYANTYQLGDGMLPKALLALKGSNIHSGLLKEKYEKYRSYLQEVLSKDYVIGGKLNETRIFNVVREMQGCNLAAPTALNYSALYHIKVDLEQKQIIIYFPNQDYLYRNFLYYSNKIFPRDVNKQTSKNLLGNCEGIVTSLINNTESSQLTYTATNDFLELEHVLRTLPDKSREFYTQHMRQQLALEKFAAEVLAEIELTKICQNNKRGGFGHDQVQLILRHFLRNSAIYVPSYSELAEKKLPLDLLITQKYLYVAFSLQVQNNHQVALWVELKEGEYKVTVFDSTSISHVDEKALQQLRNLLSLTKDYPIHVKACFQQEDDFSCGGWLIYNILAQQGASRPQNIKAWIKHCYRAYKVREPIEVQIHAQMQKNNFVKLCLLQTIETYRKKCGFYQGHLVGTVAGIVISNRGKSVSSNDGTLQQDTFQKIADYLQQEMWGNCDRQDDPGNQVGRNDQSYERIRTRSLLDTLNSYKKEGDQEGLLILQIAYVIADKDEEQFILIIEQALKIIAANKADMRKNIKINGADEVIRLLETELALKVNKKNDLDKIFLLENLFSNIYFARQDVELLKQKTAKKILKNIFLQLFKKNSSRYFLYAKANISYFSMLYQILSLITKQLLQFNDYAKAEKERKIVEEEAHQAMQKNMIIEVKATLSMIVDPELFDESFYVSLTQNQFIYLRVKKFLLAYVKNGQKNFSTGTEKTLEIFLIKLIDYCQHHDWNLASELAQLDKEYRLGFAEAWQDKIQNDTPLDSVLLQLDKKDRPDFARANLDRMEDGYELSDVLQTLKKTETESKWTLRLRFAIATQDKIADGVELALVAQELNKNDRPEFIENNISKIENGYEVADILEVLKDTEAEAKQALCIRLSMELSDKIQNGAQLARVIDQLDKPDRLKLAEALWHKIQDGRELVLVLKQLDKTDRLGFAEKCIDCIQGAYHLAEVLETLEQSSWLEFAKQLQHLITGNYAHKVLNILDIQDCSSFTVQSDSELLSQQAPGESNNTTQLTTSVVFWPSISTPSVDVVSDPILEPNVSFSLV